VVCLRSVDEGEAVCTYKCVDRSTLAYICMYYVFCDCRYGPIFPFLLSYRFVTKKKARRETTASFAPSFPTSFPRESLWPAQQRSWRAASIDAPNRLALGGPTSDTGYRFFLQSLLFLRSEHISFAFAEKNQPPIASMAFRFSFKPLTKLWWIATASVVGHPLPLGNCSSDMTRVVAVPLFPFHLHLSFPTSVPVPLGAPAY